MSSPLRTRIPVVALFFAALVAAAGCVIPFDETGGDPDARTSAPAPSGSRGSLEGAFSPSTMDDYLREIVPYITSWMEATWPGMPLPEVSYVPDGVEGPQQCLTPNGRRALYTTDSYEYCPASETIYVGQDMLWTFYDRTGDAGPAVGLAHEFGHHVQAQLGLTSRLSAIETENQADCLAGAWIRYTDETLGVLEYPDDLEDIDALFPLIGSAEGPERDHGTVRERAQAFQAGFDGGVGACGV